MNGTIREFTKKEFDVFVVKNGYETFTADQVLKFNQEVINNQESMDEFSKSCAAADFVSLNRAIVIDDDLVKSVVYYRECQIEPLEKEEFGSIMKSKQVVFADTALNRFKGIVGLPVDNDVIEKARKAEPIGTEKTYGGKLYIKTEKSWRLKPKGIKNTNKEESSEKIPSSIKIDQKTFHIKDGKIQASMYDTQKRISKVMKYAKENGLKVDWMESSKKEAPLLRQVTAAQYKDRKDEIIGEISKERLNLMNKYGDNWQDDASSKDLERLSSLVSRVNKLGENFNQFGDKSKNSSEHQMTEAQMRAYATARDPKAKEIELNDLKSQLKKAKETVEDIESSVEYGGAAKAEMIRIGKKKINSLEKKIAKLEEKK